MFNWSFRSVYNVFEYKIKCKLPILLPSSMGMPLGKYINKNSKTIGRGTFGKVKKAIHKLSG